MGEAGVDGPWVERGERGEIGGGEGADGGDDVEPEVTKHEEGEGAGVLGCDELQCRWEINTS